MGVVGVGALLSLSGIGREGYGGLLFDAGRLFEMGANSRLDSSLNREKKSERCFSFSLGRGQNDVEQKKGIIGNEYTARFSQVHSKRQRLQCRFGSCGK